MIWNGPIQYVYNGDSETLNAENSKHVVLISCAELFKWGNVYLKYKYSQLPIIRAYISEIIFHKPIS